MNVVRSGWMLVTVVIGALVSSPAGAPVALAAACPDVEVVFARGTFEPPGAGTTGDAFISELRARTQGKSVEVYPVDYPASLDFATAVDGVVDASNKIRNVAASCPDTKIVASGFSQGAAVIAYTTADSVPPGYELPAELRGPMPADVADHVAAVALFGKPSSGFLQRIDNDAPPINIGHLYAEKTIDLCADGDPICSVDGADNAAHGAYPFNGMTAQAADFVVAQLAAPVTQTPA